MSLLLSLLWLLSVGIVCGAIYLRSHARRLLRKRIAEIDSVLMLLQGERARAAAIGAEQIVVPIDTLIGSLTRVRVGIVEGRVDFKKEIAAVVAADEQIDAMGREQRGAA